MEPQACLQRILDAVKSQDAQEYRSAFEDLGDWLMRGGFPPTLKSLTESCGMADVAVYSEYDTGRTEKRVRKIIQSTPNLDVDCTTQFSYHIMVADHLNETGNGPYVFAVYTPFRGDLIKQFELPM